ncbi:MAG: hypothetical protein ACP5KE_01565 [Candidatus Methanodesulfokora sp.]|nr:MAG: hypothetical protein C0200_06355 [Candidatus Korarchaeota archaeon]
MESLDEAITVSKKGKRELRSIVARGKFAIIEYLDPDTKKRTEDKVKLVLARDDGKVEEYFLIPTATPSRLIAIVPKEKKGQEIKAFNPRTGKVENIIL